MPELPAELATKKKTFDDRPLSVLFGPKPGSVSPQINGASIPPKLPAKSEKRRSLQNLGSSSPELGGSQISRDSPRIHATLVEETTDFASPLPSPHTQTDSFHSPLSSPGFVDSDSEDRTDITPRKRPIPSEQNSRTPRRPPVSLDRVPPRSQSLSTQAVNGSRPSSGEGLASDRLSPAGSPKSYGLRPQRSFDDRPRAGSPLKEDRRASSSLSREIQRQSASSLSPPNSPAHFADVPQSVESGTDTEAEADSGNGQSVDDHEGGSPPALPAKEKPRPSELNLQVDKSFDPDVSDVSQLSAHDIEDASVERTSIATFIAPALPPIRFSMNGADFGELLKSVNGLPSIKDQLSKISEGIPNVAPTPPPTASSFANAVQVMTPSSDATIGGPSESPSSPPPSSIASEQTLTTQSNHHRTESSTSTPSLEGGAVKIRPLPDPRDVIAPLRPSNSLRRRQRFDSNSASPRAASNAAESQTRSDTSNLAIRRLQEALADAADRGAQQLKFDKGFVEVILQVLELRQNEHLQLKSQLDNFRVRPFHSSPLQFIDPVLQRTSKQYIDGLTVAETEYDQEVKARRDAEAEVTRLRVLLSGQAARLSALSGDSKRREVREQMTEELNQNLYGLEKDLSKLKVERDVTLAEVEELSASKTTPRSVSECAHIAQPSLTYAPQ